MKTGDKVETFKKTTKYTNDSQVISPTDTTIIDEEPTEAIRTSVETYGGFYIAAYEAGVPVAEDGTTEISVESATTSQKARSVAGATVWTNITRTNAIIAAENMIETVDEVKSGLISGECWDTTLQWMVNSSTNAANEPNKGYDTDSTGKGYYGQTSKTTTGQFSINNIYDMAGNTWEWTTENCKVNGVRYSNFRGGSFSNSGSNDPAAKRVGNSNTASNRGTFRIVLYK